MINNDKRSINRINFKQVQITIHSNRIKNRKIINFYIRTVSAFKNEIKSILIANKFNVKKIYFYNYPIINSLDNRVREILSNEQVRDLDRELKMIQ